MKNKKLTYKNFAKIIEFALGEKIAGLRIFKGYNDDYVLHIESHDTISFNLISSHAKIDFDVNIINHSMYIVERESKVIEGIDTPNFKMPFINFED